LLDKVWYQFITRQLINLLLHSAIKIMLENSFCGSPTPPW